MKTQTAAVPFMRRALQLAEHGVGRTSPNPPVGAVVVRGGVIVGEGYHRRAGELHAEPIALRNAGEATRGADIYVTLEPCCHQGRTPPCTEAIVSAGIARVFYAVPDPDPCCAGGGEAALRTAGLQVDRGLLADEVGGLLEGYVRHRRTGRPLVTLKLAMSLDGRIATRTGDSRWITGDEARALVHQVRNRSDAVIVGIGTVLADDPVLTTRGIAGGRDALRVVVDSTAKTPPQAQVIEGGSDAGCIIACTEHAPAERMRALEQAGAELLVLPGGDGGVDLAALVEAFGQRGALNVLIEGGGELAAGALTAGVVDKVMLFHAPVLIGGREAKPGIGGDGVERMADALRLTSVTVQQVGRDVLTEGYLTPREDLRSGPEAACSRG